MRLGPAVPWPLPLAALRGFKRCFAAFVGPGCRPAASGLGPSAPPGPGLRPPTARSPLASSLARCLGLVAAGPLRLGRLGRSPGVARCGGPRPLSGPLPGCRPRGLSGGLRCAWALRGSAGSLGGRPWPSPPRPPLPLRPLARPCAAFRRPGSPSASAPSGRCAAAGAPLPRCVAGGGLGPWRGLFRLRRRPAPGAASWGCCSGPSRGLGAPYVRAEGRPGCCSRVIPIGNLSVGG